MVNYKRTHYKHKETGERAYLIDRLVGYGPHARVDPLVKAQALETAVELSYRKSGEEAGRSNREIVLSGEAVKKVIHNFTPEKLSAPPKEKRRLKALYVEADKDHVAGQDKKSHLPRLVYIHEGKEKVGKGRFKLKRPYYIAGLYPQDTDELWLKVLSYIAVRDCRRYIRLNWDGIMAYRSGIIALPAKFECWAWSAKDADWMARLRAMKANGVSLRESYAAQCREEFKPFKTCQTAVAQERQKPKKVVGEVSDNFPALRGPVTQLSRALKALSRNFSLVWQLVEVSGAVRFFVSYSGLTRSKEVKPLDLCYHI